MGGTIRNAGDLTGPERHAGGIMELGRGARWEGYVNLCDSHKCYVGIVSTFFRDRPEHLPFSHHAILCQYMECVCFRMGQTGDARLIHKTFVTYMNYRYYVPSRMLRFFLRLYGICLHLKWWIRV